ncbi:hypothetical protein [Acidocella sp.]|jgi:hypothetical protein|uniref:hypothetical protein n=1 Tax=Acidocella sp. TaxID=50710 RepID=UPI002F400FA7
MNVMSDAPAAQDSRPLKAMAGYAADLRDAIYAIQGMVKHDSDGIEADKARVALMWTSSKMESDADALNDILLELSMQERARTASNPDLLA